MKHKNILILENTNKNPALRGVHEVEDYAIVVTAG